MCLKRSEDIQLGLKKSVTLYYFLVGDNRGEG